MNLRPILRTALSSLAFGTLGLIVFAVVFWLFAKSMPFSLRKEVEDDQNTSLGILIGAVIVGIAMILAAAIEG